MTKVKDCIECGPRFNTWTAFNKIPRKGRRSRALGKRQIRFAKRDHGIYEYHLFAFDFNRALYVKGCSQRQLIHKGGKP